MAIFNGAALRALREAAGVTQAELAESMGYFAKGVPNRSMISALERKQNAINPRQERLAKDYLQGRAEALDRVPISES